MDIEPPGERPCMHKTDGFIYVHVRAGCGKEVGFLLDTFGRLRAFHERLCESRKTIFEVHLDSAFNKAICATFLPLLITLSLEEGGGGAKVPYESFFVCLQCANF